MVTHAEVIDPALTRELRRAILRPSLPAAASLPGDDLPDAVHFGVRIGQAIVSTCFVFPDPCPWLPERSPAWHLRQMATAPEHRGRGYAGLAVVAALAHVRAAGADILWLQARERAVPMYERHGFIGVGELFTDEEHTVPHLRMWQPVGAKTDEITPTIKR